MRFEKFTPKTEEKNEKKIQKEEKKEKETLKFGFDENEPLLEENKKEKNIIENLEKILKTEKQVNNALLILQNNKRFKISDLIYLHNTIFNLKKPVLEIINEIKNEIDKNYYEVIIGDDASGRIPTLIFREIINERRKKLNIKEGITTKFIAGGKGSFWDETKITKAKELIQKMKIKNKKSLLITEYISQTGVGFATLASILEKEKVDFDCIILASYHKKKFYLKKFPVFRRHRFLIGREQNKPFSTLYGDYEMTGVRKEFYNDVLTKRTKNNNKYYIYYSRFFIKELAQEVVNNVWEEKK